VTTLAALYRAAACPKHVRVLVKLNVSNGPGDVVYVLFLENGMAKPYGVHVYRNAIAMDVPRNVPIPAHLHARRDLVVHVLAPTDLERRTTLTFNC
jgi:hypothetical protein